MIEISREWYIVLLEILSNSDPKSNKIIRLRFFVKVDVINYEDINPERLI